MIFSRNHLQPDRVILNHLPTAYIAETLGARAACTNQAFTFPFSRCDLGKEAQHSSA